MNIPAIVAHAKTDPSFTLTLIAQLQRIPVMGPWHRDGLVWTRTSVNGDGSIFHGKATERLEYLVLWDSGAPFAAVLRMNHRDDVGLHDVTWDLDTITPEVAAVIEGEKAKIDARLRASGWLLL